MLLLSLADSEAAIKSNQGKIRVFYGAILFLEATKTVRISLVCVDTRK